jgi:hypothetical protein
VLTEAGERAGPTPLDLVRAAQENVLDEHVEEGRVGRTLGGLFTVHTDLIGITH